VSQVGYFTDWDEDSPEDKHKHFMNMNKLMAEDLELYGKGEMKEK